MQPGARAAQEKSLGTDLRAASPESPFRIGLERQGHHELPHPDRRQYAVDEAERGLGHATAQTRGTEAAPPTAEGRQPTLAAVLVREHHEASTEQATVEIALELAPYELGQRGRDRFGLRAREMPTLREIRIAACERVTVEAVEHDHLGGHAEEALARKAAVLVHDVCSLQVVVERHDACTEDAEVSRMRLLLEVDQDALDDGLGLHEPNAANRRLRHVLVDATALADLTYLIESQTQERDEDE